MASDPLHDPEFLTSLRRDMLRFARMQLRDSGAAGTPDGDGVEEAIRRQIVLLWRTRPLRREKLFVADEIDRLSDAGQSQYGDTAIFYRTNAQSRAFEEVFIRVGMPYKVVGGVRFYERREIRAAIAYLLSLIHISEPTRPY